MFLVYFNVWEGFFLYRICRFNENDFINNGFVNKFCYVFFLVFISCNLKRKFIISIIVVEIYDYYERDFIIDKIRFSFIN